MSKIRLKEVAAAAGVSISTAAAALREESIVKQSTRDRVQRVAKELGYRKNTAAAMLSSMENRSQQKALLVAWVSALPYLDEKPPIETLQIPRLGRQSAEELGLFFEYRNIRQAEDAKRIFRELDARGCDGIVWGRCILEDIPDLPWHRFSVVSTEQSNLHKGFDIIRSNYFRSMLNLLMQLKQSGYKRIGVWLREHMPRHPDDEARYGGAAAFNTMYVDQNDRVPVLARLYNQTDDQACLLEWYQRHRPDVIVGFNHHDYKLALQAGIDIPGSSAFVALHVRQANTGELAGLKHNDEIIPRDAIRTLMEKMRHGIRGTSQYPRETVIASPFVTGSSCPKMQQNQPGTASA